MLVIKVELWPRGDESQKRVLGVAEIANAGGTRERGDYDVRLLKWGEGRRTWKRGRVSGFPRLKLGPWDLLYRALAATIGPRNRQAEPPSDDAVPFGEVPIDALAAELTERLGEAGSC